MKVVEMFYLNSNLNFGILLVLVFQLEVYYKVDTLRTGLTVQQKGTAVQWYSNKTSLQIFCTNFPFILEVSWFNFRINTFPTLLLCL